MSQPSVLGAFTSYASYDVWDGISTKTPSLLWFKHYCCSLLTGSPKFVMDKFQKVLNAAARVISNSRKYDRGFTYTRRHELHWLDILERIQFRTAVTVHRCLNGLAPAYLTERCTPITQSRSSCRLRSSYRNLSLIHIWRCRRRG